MKTYDEKTWTEISNPDLAVGYTYPSRRKIGTERRTHAGTETMYPPNGLQYDVPVYEDCLLYHAYSEEELAAMQPPKNPAPGDAPTWEEMAAAYTEGVRMA